MSEYEIVFSESHSMRTRRYKANKPDLASAVSECQDLLTGAIRGEGWVRLECPEDNDCNVYSDKA